MLVSEDVWVFLHTRQSAYVASKPAVTLTPTCNGDSTLMVSACTAKEMHAFRG